MSPHARDKTIEHFIQICIEHFGICIIQVDAFSFLPTIQVYKFCNEILRSKLARATSQIEGKIVISEQYQKGLSDIQKGQHIYVLYHIHTSPEFTDKYYNIGSFG